MESFASFETIEHYWYQNCKDQFRTFINIRHEQMLKKGECERSRIGSVQELEQYNAKMKKVFQESIGGIPETTTPVKAQVTNTQDMGSFLLESILLETRPGSYVTASMYLPKERSVPAPAVLFVCGHCENGRMFEDYQMVCQTLVRAGLIVFAMDNVGHGERSNFYDAKKKVYVLDRLSDDHEGCGIPAIATGKFLESYILQDQMRAIDYMLTRKEIDPKKIGVTGNSVGGLQTLAMMIWDDRIAAAAPGTYVTTRRENIHTIQFQDVEQFWSGVSKAGFDHVNPFLLMAPRPAAILATTADIFPMEGTLETFAEGKRFYGMFGKENNLRMYQDEYTHKYTERLAICAAEFFSEVLAGKKVTVTNDDITIYPEEMMYATESGNIMGEIPDARMLPEEIADYAASLREARWSLPGEERRERAKKWLTQKIYCDHREPVAFLPRVFDQNPRQVEDYIGYVLSFKLQKGLACEGTIIKRKELKKTRNIPVVVAIWKDGSKSIAKHEEWIRKQCDSGKQVLVLDLPGVGPNKQEMVGYSDKYKEHYGMLYRLSYDLISMGDSMAALQCYGVLRTIEMLHTQWGIREEEITLHCQDDDGVYGVMAGFLNEKVNMEYSDQLLLSVEKELAGAHIVSRDNVLGLIVPGMLEYFDYEELMRR